MVKRASGDTSRVEKTSSNVKKLLITTTVPETLHSILGLQPRFLSAYFDVSLATSAGDTVDAIRERECVPVAEVPMVRRIDPVADMKALLAMIAHIRKLRPDVIHSYTPKAGLITMLAAWVCRVPVRVHTFTGLLFPTAVGMQRLLYIALDKLICMCATRVVPEGEGVRRDLTGSRITGKRLEVIGHGNIAGVDTQFFSPEAGAVTGQAHVLRRDLGIGDGAFVFCFIGRLNRDKGIAELVEAFGTLPESAHLLIVGAVDLSAPAETGALAAISTHRRIHRLGYQNDVRPALAAADVLVLPSYREGFPNVVLQAGAMGVPSIASDISGCNEVISPESNGWLVPPRSADALASCMKEAMGVEPQVLSQMGQRARSVVQERFERTAHWERMRSFYTDCVTEK
ncbi:glycosyltransferase family 4 protein [Massilia sp. Dwa41.01b]|uniref:glycosyltransferase family 4 protein n=1 Tax=Massilia sp. Se16.2.3 TaxID=2709303 RepID=UPI0016011EEF|nr:glycosyltransferase family 4 protein [Massilia sp. Se16.2.3]QNA89670.1 glycosyltransferase family 4 protein [Massilia sp. Dwa41.01b]QNB01497.1 glycosyltransferase family 4 protein [Massilia sp. Se16.2.3]